MGCVSLLREPQATANHGLLVSLSQDFLTDTSGAFERYLAEAIRRMTPDATPEEAAALTPSKLAAVLRSAAETRAA